MKKATNESVIIARHINAFLNEYVPSQKSRSSHTLKSYQYALTLYIGFLETEKGISAESLCRWMFQQDNNRGMAAMADGIAWLQP